jgi:hypothetical protein
MKEMRSFWGLLCALVLVGAAACSASEPGGGGGGGDTPDAGNGGLIDAGEACNGCIDIFGECVDGTSPNACGGNGNDCVQCELGDECADQVCTTPPACGPDNCSGCCAEDGSCVESGNVGAATCGADGMQCTDCGDGSCVDGACKAPCSPDTCTGCCAGPTIDDCIPVGNDQSVAQCGSGGEACDACGAQDTCTQGSCVSTSCSADCPNGCCDGVTCRDGDSVNECGTGGEACFACGPDQTCTDGACVVDPDSLWNFVVLNVEVPVTDPDGEAWDPFGGAPDPYVVVTLGQGSADEVSAETTEVGSNVFTFSFNPPDGEVVISNVPARAILDSVLVEAFDEDNFSDTLVQGIIDDMPPEDLFSGDLFQLSFGGTTIRFRVVKPASP